MIDLPHSSIARRLTSSFGLLILILLLMGGYTFYETHTISRFTRTIYDHPLVVSNAALQSNVSITKMHRNMKDVVLFSDRTMIQRAIAQVDVEEQVVYTNLDIVKDRILGQEGILLEAQARQLFSDWKSIREEVIELVQGGKRERAADITVGKGAKHVEKLEKQMLGLTQYARSKATSFLKEAEKTQIRLRIASILFLFAAVAFAAIITFYSLRRTALAEAELQESQQLLANAIDHAPIGMVLLEPNGNFYKANQAYCEITGFSERELQEMTYQDVTLPEDDNIGAEVIASLLRGESGKAQIEKRYVRKNGDIVNVYLTTTLLRDVNGEPQYFFTQAQDFTERIKIQEELEESENRYRILFKSGSDAIFIVEMQTLQILDANDKAVELYGFSYEELLRLKATDISAEPQKTSTSFSAYKEKIIPIRYHRKKDGTVFPVEITANYLTQGDRRINISSIRDISERTEMERRLNQAQRLESIGILAGGIAHDFNNLLSSMLGYTELALDSVKKGSQIEDDLQEAFGAGKRARDLVKQILMFARKSDEEVEPVQVDIIVKEVLKFIRSSTPTTITIEEKINSQSRVLGATTHVHQILMNLLTNAVQAMETTGGVLRIELEDVVVDQSVNKKLIDLHPGNYMKLTVKDTGLGISASVIGSIFEPYFTTKQVGEGTGFGLAVVHGIVESYKGKILVESEEGKGTAFHTYLPIVEEEVEEPSGDKEVLPSGTESILVVDDELSIIKVIARILSNLGYKVTTVTDSYEALKLFVASPEKFDLIFSDITMPNMTGDKLALEMIRIRPDIPIILATGYTKKFSEIDAIKLGVKAFLNKPIEKGDLANTVRKVLDKNSSL